MQKTILPAMIAEGGHTMDFKEANVTKEAAEFVFKLQYEDLPSEALRIAKRCILDGLGVILAGSSQKCVEIIRNHCQFIGQAREATVFGKDSTKVPATLAALVNGTAGHAMDWDDTQVSADPDRVYGLLTHPTIPPLTACLAISEKLGRVSGTMFLTAFLAGFEVECKVAEAISPDHYKKGFHTSGTIGTFGAAMAAAKLMKLDDTQLRHAIGLAASMGAGIRANFGTMTKPLHVGRAAHNGVTAAILAKDGFEANMDALDGPWGFLQVLGGGFDHNKISGCFGKPHTIIDPGVSIKPYPSGVLTHPSMDAMLAIVVENNLKPDDIESVVLYAGTNILKPIRYPVARNELEAKFCMPFLLCAIAISRKAGVREFTHEFVNSSQVQALTRRIRTEFDPKIEAQGWDKIRSRLEVTLKDGRTFIRKSDERYRGGPDHPLSDDELRSKFTDCTERLLCQEARENIFETIAALEQVDGVEKLITLTEASV
jgi:2-methylcitrate dehydratase PrpD